MSGVKILRILEQVDLPRTNTENAKSGVKFIFQVGTERCATAVWPGSHAGIKCGSRNQKPRR